MNKELLEIVGSGKPTGSVLKETIVVSATISISVESRHSRILLRALLRGRVREMRREPEVPEARVPVEECFDCPAKITSNELAPIHSVKNGILQNACSTSRRMDADLGKSALMRIARLKKQPSKRSKKNTKVQWLCWKLHDNWVVSKDMEPPTSSPILHKSSNILKPIRCVRFTKAVLRHAKIRIKNPSLGYIYLGERHQRSPQCSQI